jgi:hypothetical protein
MAIGVTFISMGTLRIAVRALRPEINEYSMEAITVESGLLLLVVPPEKSFASLPLREFFRIKAISQIGHLGCFFVADATDQASCFGSYSAVVYLEVLKHIETDWDIEAS